MVCDGQGIRGCSVRGLMKRVSVFGAAVFWAITCAGCGPVKGYPGPERPVSQLLTISTQGSDNVRFSIASVDRISFGLGSIQSLPGEHSLEVEYSVRGIGRNCAMDRLYENSVVGGPTDEERCLKRNPSDSVRCSLKSLEKPMELRCDYPYVLYKCWTKAVLSDPGRYELLVSPSTERLLLVGGKIKRAFDCNVLRAWSEREKMR